MQVIRPAAIVSGGIGRQVAGVQSAIKRGAHVVVQFVDGALLVLVLVVLEIAVGDYSVLPLSLLPNIATELVDGAI